MGRDGGADAAKSGLRGADAAAQQRTRGSTRRDWAGVRGVGGKAVSVGGAAPYTPAFVTRHDLVGWRPESAISRFRDTTNGN